VHLVQRLRAGHLGLLLLGLPFIHAGYCRRRSSLKYGKSEIETVLGTARLFWPVGRVACCMHKWLGDWRTLSHDWGPKELLIITVAIHLL